MSQNTVDTNQSLALETAWQHYAQLENSASAALRQYLNLRGWAILLTTVTTLLAIVSHITERSLTASIAGDALRGSLILVPLVSLLILAFANKLQQREYWQVLRTGAKEIEREIYLYRTILQGQEKRHQWLNERVTAIQRRVFESLGGEIVLKPYTGKIPPDYPGIQNSDSGFTDLLPDDYLPYRLEAQIEWHSQEVARLNATRTRLQVGIFALGGLSAFLAALGSNFSLWVAFTTSLGAAITIWLEVRRLDSLVNNDNQLILELNIIRDRWQSLNSQERTGEEFFKLVLATEKVIWSRHNHHITQMRQAVAEFQATTSDLLTQVMREPAPSTIGKAWSLNSQAETKTLPAQEEKLPKKATVEKTKKEQKKPQNKKGLPHAFVVMPFGRKKGPDGRWIDFNSIYGDLIKPALEEAGFEPFRADEETVSGDILTDMFQELLLADLVLADLSVDNANVFYELGIRHALRKRGLIHIQSGRAYMPYDIFNVRTIPYQCDDNGRPDPQYLEKDKQAIVKIALATWASDQNRVHSPIFNILTGLCEPDRKALRTPLATGYWQEYKEWQERVAIAQRQKHIGDVLLLTEEVKNPLIQEDAISEAGLTLKSLGLHALALQQYRRALKINPKNSEFRREEAFHLNRLQKSDEAIVKLDRLLRDEPTDIDAISYLARTYKERWKDEWINKTDEQERTQEAYESVYLLKKAIETYLKGFRLNQNRYYPGINALTLSAVLDHLAQQAGTDSNDPEVEAIRQQLPSLKGAVQFSLETAVYQEANNPWVFLSVADLTVCTAHAPKEVTRAYKKAIALAGKNKFALNSTLDQLNLLDLLNFRSEYVKAGIAVLQAEINTFKGDAKVSVYQIDQEPQQVFLFSGHMIDRPNRAQPRFPAAMESEARQKIEKVLDELKANSSCLAIAPGIACGGDILFIEACLQRQIKVEIFLPFVDAEFIQDSVSFAGKEWVERFYKIRNHPQVTIHLQPERVGAVPPGDNPYERNNRWALYSTLSYGINQVRLIVLWNGQGGDAPGGTGHMVEEVRRLGGIVEHLDTTKFDYWKANEKVVEFPKITTILS